MSQKECVNTQKISKDWSHVVHCSSGESRRYLFVWVNNHIERIAGGYGLEGFVSDDNMHKTTGF